MVTRREFLETAGTAAVLGGLASQGAAASPTQRKRLAIITTLFIEKSHGQHIGDRFIVGYPLRGKWHRPQMDVVAAYVDQKPAGDLSERRGENADSKFIRRSPRLFAAAAGSWPSTPC